ncbi:MAG: ABC transporter substrate-binding protein [Betaproteobacteria bacterium]|nr:ABC transporter substrate-binding protein [Betaproteobacteria bacterium]
MKRIFALLVLATLPFTATAPAWAKTLRWSSQGDIATLDPHGQDEGFTKSNQALVYERLLLRGKDMSLQSGLAVEWKNTGPTTWVLKLRKGVKWHDGTDFTADDVVFSFERAAKSKQYRTYAQPVGTAKKIDAHTVEFTTPQPNPVTLTNISEVPILSKAWAEKNNVVAAQDPSVKEPTFAVRNAMGTGPFTIVSYEPGVKTVFKKNPNWWGLKEGRFTSNVEMVEYRPIGNGATRMAALKSGELDFVLDPSVQDIAQLKQDKALKVWEGDETRIIMIALDQARDELLFSDVKGKNPFKDRRVRQALYQAIDINAINKTVMRGLSRPTAIPLPDPKGEGIEPALDKRLPLDLNAAKKLLADAGYPNGFGFTLHCPNDRYVNDEKICIALAAMWAKIGLKVTVDAMPKAQYFQRTPKKEFSACMQGWGSNARDAIFTLKPVLHSLNDKGWGDTNYGNFKSEELDKLIAAAEVEMDVKKRNALINDAVRVIQKETLILPLHRQITPWVSRAGVTVVHRIDNWLVPHWTKLP